MLFEWQAMGGDIGIGTGDRLLVFSQPTLRLFGGDGPPDPGFRCLGNIDELAAPGSSATAAFSPSVLAARQGSVPAAIMRL